jgi:hypothetical protein
VFSKITKDGLASNILVISQEKNNLSVLHHLLVNPIEDMGKIFSENENLLLSASSIVIDASKEQSFFSKCINEIGEKFKGKSIPKIYWMGQDFEFSGSTLPIPEFIEDGRIYLSNHFLDYFDIPGKLLISLTAWTSSSKIEQQYFINPRETLMWKLSDLNLESPSEGYIAIDCYHPVLSKGRHNRWRMWADLYYLNSMVSLHSAHDFGPAYTAGSFFPESLVKNSERLILSIPNYGQDSIDNEVDLFNTKSISNIDLPNEPVAFIDITRTADQFEGNDYGVSYKYNGYGTSYWFNKIKAKNTILANHEVSVNTKAQKIKITRKMKNRLKELNNMGFTPAIHFLPISNKNEKFEYGFSGDWSYPAVKNIILSSYNEKGALLDEIESEIEQGINFTSFFENILPKNTHQIGIRPDFTKIGIDPRQWSPYLSMFVKTKQGDIETTEFQNSWRNLGVVIPEFPHWLSNKKGISGSSHLVGRWTNLDGLEAKILIINGSGNKQYDSSGVVEVSIYSKAGEILAKYDLLIAPFTHEYINLKDISPDTVEFGFVRIRSRNADLNAYMITLTENGGVGLQHLWGY